MTASEIISRIRSECSLNSTDRFSDAEVLVIVNEGYVDFCRYSQCLEKLSTEVIAAYDAIVELPSDFLEARQTRLSYNRPLYPKSARQLDYDEQAWPFRLGTPEETVYWNYNVLRLKPITSAAGTVTFRHSYIPSDLTSTAEPQILDVFHQALIDFGCAEIFYGMRDFKNADLKWASYKILRQKGKAQARQWQQTPDTLLAQRPVTVFNYPLWDNRYRSRA